MEPCSFDFCSDLRGQNDGSHLHSMITECWYTLDWGFGFLSTINSETICSGFDFE